jgi:Flp pilus assembly pilin Flp
MSKVCARIYVIFNYLREEHGQDLIEYVLIGGIVALGATAGMSTFAADVNAAFTSLGSTLTSYT